MESKFKIKNSGLHKSGQIGTVSQMKRDFQLHFLKQMELKPSDTFLEIGSGTLRGGLPIIDYLDEGKYTGVELRTKAFDLAKQELHNYHDVKSKSPTLVNSSFTEFKSKKKFKVIWSFAVLFHVHDVDMDAWFRQIDKYLAKGGVYYANIMHDTHSAGWDRPNDPRMPYPLLFRDLGWFNGVAANHGIEGEDIGSCKYYGHELKPDEDNQRMIRFTRNENLGI